MRAWFEDRTHLLQLLICVLPFVVLYWLVPFIGTMTIGNDYVAYSIEQQMELRYSLVHGTFPLYAPGFAGGRSAAAMTLGQMYHPISWLAAHSPGYWSGYALEWNTFWRLVSLGITQLVLFNLLLRLKLRTDVSFIISFLTVYNERMLDMFRYGASLENYTAFLMLCAAIIYIFIAPESLLAKLALVGATYLMICGGHPQIAYLGFLGAILIYAVVPLVVPLIERKGVAREEIFRYYRMVPAFVGLGILCSAVYLLPFYFEFLRDDPARIDQTYQWSLAYSDTIGGALNSFFNPLRSDVHGAFGSSPLILIAIVGPLFALVTTRLRGRTVAMLLWAATILIFVVSIGDDAHLYYLFWKLVPAANSIRTPGRIAMMLLPFLMLLLAWFFSVADEDAGVDAQRSMLPWAIVLSSLVVYVIGYILSADVETGPFSPMNIGDYPDWINNVIFGCGAVALLLATIRVSSVRSPIPIGLLLSAVVVFQVAVQLRHGTWVRPTKYTPGLTRMDREKKASLAFRGSLGWGMESATPGISPGARSGSGQRRFDSGRPSYRPAFPMAVYRPAAILSPSWSYPPASPQNPIGASSGIPVATLFSSFNRLTLKVYASMPGFVALTVPYSPQWHAFLGDKECAIRPTDKNELAIAMPIGSDEVVDVRYYSPATTIGMLISCATLVMVAIWFALRGLTGRLRNSVILGTLLIVAVGLLWWERSLYTGDNLGMQFRAPSISMFAR